MHNPKPLYTVSAAGRLLDRAGAIIIGDRAHAIVTLLSAQDALQEVIDAYEAERRQAMPGNGYAPVERTLQEEIAWTQKERDSLRAERDRLKTERCAWKREWAREAARREQETGVLRRRVVALETDCERQRQELAAVHNVNETLGNLALRYMPAEDAGE